MIDSITSNPTLKEGSFWYGSRTIWDWGTSTKYPLIKYTPGATPTAYPIAEASIDTAVKIVSPELRVVFPYVTFSSMIRTSPSANSTLDSSEAPSRYFTKRVISSTPSSGGKRYPLITPTTSVSSPTTLVPLPSFAFTRASRYTVISIPKCVGFTLTVVNWLSQVTPPGITIEPSLNIWVPKDSIWLCKIDWRPVNSLAWTGYPGLKRTL